MKRTKGEYTHTHTHLNAEFQRIARRDKKGVLCDQCKEIEENNRMGKTRDLFKKIRSTNGAFNVKMGAIQDRNGMDLTESEDIKKRWQKHRKTKPKSSSDLANHEDKPQKCCNSPRARNLGVLNQVYLRKHHYDQS